jgi:hypothetical protein
VFQLMGMARRFEQLAQKMNEYGVQRQWSSERQNCELEMIDLAAKLDKGFIALARRFSYFLLVLCGFIAIVFLYAMVVVIMDKSVSGFGYLAVAFSGLAGFAYAVCVFVLQLDDEPYPNLLVNNLVLFSHSLMLLVYAAVYGSIVVRITYSYWVILILPTIAYLFGFVFVDWIGRVLIDEFDLGQYYDIRLNTIRRRE